LSLATPTALIPTVASTSSMNEMNRCRSSAPAIADEEGPTGLPEFSSILLMRALASATRVGLMIIPYSRSDKMRLIDPVEERLMKQPRLTDLDTWEQCQKRIHEIEQENTREVWFRGLADNKWELTTTLERRISPRFTVGEYFDSMSRVKAEIEAITGRHWEKPTWPESEDTDFGRHFMTNPAFAFMALLRHHGFPSPLLDWTRSPFIAAFFAFASAQPETRVAIYPFRKCQIM
jgi:FRG domain